MAKHLFPNKDMEDLYWLFVYNRQRAWQNRHIYKLDRQQWTGDAIIANARFTNVYRELDRGTQYAIVEIAERHADRTSRLQAVAIFHLLAYRWFNRIETYEAMAPHLTSMLRSNGSCSIDVEIALRERQVMGGKLYTGAYIATYCPDLGGNDSIDNAIKVLKIIAEHTPFISRSAINFDTGQLRDLTALLQKMPGFGNFMAYQAALDFTYELSNLCGKKIAPFADQNSWTQLGPGAKKGLELLGVKGPIVTLVRAAKELAASQIDSFARLNVEFPYIQRSDGSHVLLTVANMEHSLCEFQKYYRMLGGGHVKTIYSSGLSSNWVSPYPTTPFLSSVKEGAISWQR